MLTQVADGVLVHESAFMRSNAVVVPGPTGVLLVDPGIQDHEMACLADDLSRRGETVVAGFSTHPHWDHLLWHPRLGRAPRYGTARCVAAVRDELSDPGAKARITEHLEPTGIAEHVPLDLYGLLTALPAGSVRVPWDGPAVRVIEHPAHAPGHAALYIEDRRVLVAGDMLSDVLVPMFGLGAGADSIGNYLDGLRLIEAVAGEAEVVVPGHGTVGAAGSIRARIDLDRAYVEGLRDGRDAGDPRIGPSAEPGWEWVRDVDAGQRQRLAAQR